MKRTFISAFAAMMLCIPVVAETLPEVEVPTAEKKEKAKKEVKYNENGEIIKTGLNFGPLPVVAFDADRGFQYGALLNIYNFGDGSTYPNPKQWWYIEASAYTGGTWNLYLNYDNREIFENGRLSICTNYSSESALDFYGFNGYQSIYTYGIDDFFKNNPDEFTFDDSDKGVKAFDKFANGAGKAPNGFYRYSRQSFRAKADLTGEIADNFYWEAGYNFSWTKTSSFTPSGYEVLAGSDFEHGTTLFDLYNAWGIIPENEAKGGTISSLRMGFMYGSRNIENNPTEGIWAEAHIIAAPKWLGTTHPHYKFCATMRQYVPIIKNKLTFAYRAGYQGTFGNSAPWYAMPFYTNMGPKADNDGFGGYRTVRGLMLNRVQGQDVGFYNVELRWRFIDFKLFNQNIAFALSGFTDAAHVFKGYDLKNETGKYLDLYNKFVDTTRSCDGFHGAAGAGFRFIMNQNFIVALEYARCFNKQDGTGAFYINTGFLF